MESIKHFLLVILLTGCVSTDKQPIPTFTDTVAKEERKMSTPESYEEDIRSLIRKRNHLHSRLVSVARYDLNLSPDLRADIFCQYIKVPAGTIPKLSAEVLALSNSHQETEALLTKHIKDLRKAISTISELLSITNTGVEECMSKYLNDS